MEDIVLKIQIEHLKMKNIMCEMENILGMINNRWDWRRKLNALSKVKHRKTKRLKKWALKYEKTLTEQIAVPEDGWKRKVFECIVAETFPNFMKTINSQIN